MAEFEFNIRDVFRILRRRKGVILLSPVLVALLTYILSEQPSYSYEAQSLVKISRVASSMQALLVEAISFYQGDNIQTQSQIITSQKVRARVALRLADKYPEFQEMKTVSSQALQDYDRLEEEVRNRPALIDLVEAIDLEAEQVGDSDIIGISTEAASPALAMDIVNYAAEEFVRYNTAEKNSQIREAVRFIQGRIRDTQTELHEAETRLEQFKRQNSAILALDTSEGGDLESQIRTLGRRISSFDKALEQLSGISSADQYMAYSPTLNDVTDPVISQLEKRLLSLSSKISESRSRRRQLLTYQTERSRQVIEANLELEELQKRIQETIASLIRRYRAIRDELAAQRAALLERQQKIAAMPRVMRELDSLQRQVKLKSEALDLYQSRLQDAQIQSASEIKEVSVVQQAGTVDVLYGTSRVFKAMVGLVMGILLGGVFAVVLESMDTSIGTIEDVERYVNIPVLGVIPHLDREMVLSRVSMDHLAEGASSRELERVTSLCTHFTPSEPVSEAFRSMRAQLDVLLSRNGWKTLLMTSSVLQEGKTNTVSNLAVVFAQTGQRTLLIDADLRRPQIHKVFGLSDSPGLSDVLLGVVESSTAVRSIDDLILGRFGLQNAHLTPGLEYLFILTAGRKVDNPAELLNPEKFNRLLDEMRERFDIVIVDSAPVLPVADASQIAPSLDAVLLAYQIGRAGREVVNRSKSRLQSVGANVVGLVMNDIEAEIYHTKDYEYYGYKYKYEEVLTPEGGLWERLKGGLSRIVSRRPRPAAPPTLTSPTRAAPRKPTRVPAAGARREQPSSEVDDIMNLTDEE